MLDVSGIRSVKFAYAISKNKKLIESEISSLHDSISEFEKERMELLKEKGKKDAKGNLLLKQFPNGIQEPIFENPDEVKKLVSELEIKHKYADYEKLLEEEISFDFYKIKFEDLPNELNAYQIDIIMPLISEE